MSIQSLMVNCLRKVATRESMFAYSDLSSKANQKAKLHYFYTSAVGIPYIDLCALWHSSGLWKENKWSKYFGKDLADMQTWTHHMIQNNFELILGIRATMFLGDDTKKIMLQSEPKQIEILNALMEMGILNEIIEDNIMFIFERSHEERQKLHAFMTSGAFQGCCIDFGNKARLKGESLKEEKDKADRLKEIIRLLEQSL